MTKPKLPAWYSETAIAFYGSSIWKNADGESIEIFMTMNKEPNYKDVKFVGYVTEYIRPGKKPAHDPQIFLRVGEDQKIMPIDESE